MVESRGTSGTKFTVGWRVCRYQHRSTKFTPLGSITNSLERSIGGGGAVASIGEDAVASIGDGGAIASIGGDAIASIGEGGAIASISGDAIASIGEGGAIASIGGGAIASIGGGAIASFGGGAIASIGGGAIASIDGGAITSFSDDSEVDDSLAPCGLRYAHMPSPLEKWLKKKRDRAAASRALAEEKWPGDFCKF